MIPFVYENSRKFFIVLFFYLLLFLKFIKIINIIVF